MKRCTKCGKEKAEDEFSKDKQKPGGRDLYCRPCRAEIQRQWRDSDRAHYRALAKARRARDPEKHNRYQADAYKKNPARWRDYNLRSHYGVTLEEYDAMVVNQKGLCALCRKPPVKGSLHLDHDHETKKIRALLCTKCNTGIGLFNEDSDLLRRAIEYIEHHRRTNA